MDRLWSRKTATDSDSSQRRKQIESLFMESPQLRVVPNDDSRFQMTLQLASNPESPLSSSSTTMPQLSRTASSPAAASKLGMVAHDGQYPPGGTVSTTATSGGSSTATLTIYLPPAFPEEEPKVTIQPTVRHLWVDGTVTPCAVTGHERLMPGGWSTHANLGRIVKEIATSIQRTGVLVVGGSDSVIDAHGTNGTTNNANSNFNNGIGSNSSNAVYEEYSHKPPPPIPGNRSKSLGQFNNPSSTSFSNSNGSHHSHHQPSVTGGGGEVASSSSSSGGVTGSGHHTQIRPNASGVYSTTLSPEARIVMELTAEQIEEYLESPIAFEHFFDQIEVVANSRTLKREWWHGNDNVSRRNLQLEAEMMELQRSVNDGHQVAMQLQKSLEEKLQQQQDALWRFKPETLQSKLRSAAAESDELSESIAQSFLEGKLDQEGFIRQYRDLRKVYHLREMKNERIGSILRNHPSGVESSSNSNSGGGGGSAQDGLGSILNHGHGSGGSGSSVAGGAGIGSAGGGGGGGAKSSSDPWVVV